MTKEFEKLWMAQFKVRIAYDSSNRIQYVGEAAAGTATSATGWRIKKLTYDGTSTRVTQIDWADSNRNFDNEWDERESYSYG